MALKMNQEKIKNLLGKLINNCRFETWVEFSEKRVAHYGASYQLFAVFAIINYIVPFFMWSADEKYVSALTMMRFIAGVLCVGLLFSNEIFDKYKKYLPIYWHFTLMFCLPLMTSFMMFANDASIYWLFNMSLGLFLLAILIDWVSFCIIVPLGILISYELYINIVGSVDLDLTAEETLLAIYMIGFSTLIGGLFSRKKERVQHLILENEKRVIELLESKIETRTAELKQALSVREEILRNVSHEVRTPIHSVTSIAVGLRDAWFDFPDEEKLRYLNILCSSAERLYRLVDVIIDLSKIQNNQYILDKKHENLEETIGDIVSEFNINGKKRNKKIFIFQDPIDSRIKPFAFDKVRIEQVMRNLIGNALKFSKEGPIMTGSTLILSDKGEEMVKVWVKDKGVGIPDGELEYIFGAFNQSSRTKTEAGGSGIGLTISKEIILRHGGEIWAANNAEKGTTFYFTLPYIFVTEVTE
jgi:two-component system sensor histidine kinase ChiS